jgi:hypothetical protein
MYVESKELRNGFVASVDGWRAFVANLQCGDRPLLGKGAFRLQKVGGTALFRILEGSK